MYDVLTQSFGLENLQNSPYVVQALVPGVRGDNGDNVLPIKKAT